MTQIAGYSSETSCVVEDAVSCEPVSAAQFPPLGESFQRPEAVSSEDQARTRNRAPIRSLQFLFHRARLATFQHNLPEAGMAASTNTP